MTPDAWPIRIWWCEPHGSRIPELPTGRPTRGCERWALRRSQGRPVDGTCERIAAEVRATDPEAV